MDGTEQRGGVLRGFAGAGQRIDDGSIVRCTRVGGERPGRAVPQWGESRGKRRPEGLDLSGDLG